MYALILAAGKGERMGFLTKNTPKPLLPINGTPLLLRTIANLPEVIDTVVLVIGYLGEMIRNTVGNCYVGRNIVYVEQKHLLGTAHTVHAARTALPDNEAFLVINGDDLYKKTDLTSLLPHKLAILGLPIFVEHNCTFDAIRKDDTDNMTGLTLATEGKTELLNTGAYMLDKRFFNEPMVQLHYKTTKEYGLPQTLANLAKKENVRVLTATDWLPMGNPQEYAVAQERWYEFFTSEKEV